MQINLMRSFRFWNRLRCSTALSEWRRLLTALRVCGARPLPQGNIDSTHGRRISVETLSSGSGMD